MFALSLRYFLSLPRGPSTNTYFLFISYEGNKQNLWKISCRFKTWTRFVGQILIKMETYFIRGFFSCPLISSMSNLSKHAGGHSVTTEACTSLADGHSVTTAACTSLVCVCVVWMSGTNWSYLRHVSEVFARMNQLRFRLPNYTLRQ